MAVFTAQRVNIDNGFKVVTIASNESIKFININDLLVINNFAPVVINKAYIGANNEQFIELVNPWPNASQSNSTAVVIPTKVNVLDAITAINQTNQLINDNYQSLDAIFRDGTPLTEEQLAAEPTAPAGYVYFKDLNAQTFKVKTLHGMQSDFEESFNESKDALDATLVSVPTEIINTLVTLPEYASNNDAAQAGIPLNGLYRQAGMFAYRFAKVASASVRNDVDYNGWVISMKLTDINLPVGFAFNELATLPNFKVTVQSAGFNSSGEAVTKIRTLVGVAILRKAYPNEQQLSAAQNTQDVDIEVVLSDYIYQNEIITLHVNDSFAVQESDSVAWTNGAVAIAVTNNSTLKKLKPIARWGVAPHQITGENIELECVVADAYGQDFKMAELVQFTITGNTSGQSVTVNATSMEKSTNPNDKQPVIVFKALLDLTSLQQGEQAIANFKVFPFIGSEVLNTAENTVNNLQLATPLPLLINHDGSYPQPVAVVNSIAGDDASGVAAIDEASAVPFKTIAAAAAALQNYNNTNHSINDASFSKVLLKNGDYPVFGGDLRSVVTEKGWLEISLAAGASKGLTRIVATPTANNRHIIKYLKLKDITCHAKNGEVLFDGSNTSVKEKSLYTENVDVTGDNENSIVFYRIGYRYHVGGSFIGGGDKVLANYSNVATHIELLRGIETDGRTGVSAFTILGCRAIGTGVTPVEPAAVNQTQWDGQYIGFNSFKSLTQRGFTGGVIETHIGTAIIQNLFEAIQTTVPILSYSADGMTEPTTGFLCFGNTFVGSRNNVGYNDEGGHVKKDRYFSRGNIYFSWNHKDDVFLHPTEGKDSSRTGSLAIGYKVGMGDEIYLTGAVAYSAPGPDSWLGEFIGVGNSVTSDVDVNFIDDKSTNEAGSGEGGGDYKLNPNSLAGTRTHRQLLPFDLAGNERLEVGALGAYEIQPA